MSNLGLREFTESLQRDLDKTISKGRDEGSVSIELGQEIINRLDECAEERERLEEELKIERDGWKRDIHYHQGHDCDEIRIRYGIVARANESLGDKIGKLQSERDAYKRVAETSADIMENRNEMRRALSDLIDLFDPFGSWRTKYGEKGFNEAVSERLERAHEVLGQV